MNKDSYLLIFILACLIITIVFLIKDKSKNARKGAIIGVLIYLGAVFIVYTKEHIGGCSEFCGLGTLISAFLLLPIIPTGTVIGWLFRKVNNKNQAQ